MTYRRTPTHLSPALIAGPLLAVATACGSLNDQSYAPPPQSFSVVGQNLAAGGAIGSSGSTGIPVGTPTTDPNGNAPSLVSPVTQTSYTVGLGQTEELSAQFNGVPTPTYQWYLNGTAISGATTATYDVTPSGASDYGSYYLVATNSFGTAQSYYFVIYANNAIVSVGSTECDGSQCGADPTTAQEVCQLVYGGQAVLASSSAYTTASFLYTNSVCSWSGSSWNCGNTTSPYNVLGYVECLE